MSLSDFLRQVAQIYHLNAQVDSSGGVYQDWTLLTTCACMVRPYSGGVDRESGKDGSAATHIIYLPGAWDLSATHQIHCGGSIYNVIRSKNVNSLNHHTEVECLVETS